MEDITISIVAFNDEEDVRKAVESIERCTSSLLRKKIYIVDNSTKDNTLYKLQDEYGDLEYRKTGENVGFGKGHNSVINELDSKYHAIVNPDVLLKEDTFSILMDFFEEYDCGMVVPRIINSEGHLLDVYRRKLTVFDMFIRMFVRDGFKKRKAYHSMKDKDYSTVFEVPFAQGSFLIIKTELFKDLQGFDERYFLYMEDADLCRRVNEVSRLLYCPGTEVIHKWERGSHKNIKLFGYHVSAMAQYFKKWGFR